MISPSTCPCEYVASPCARSCVSNQFRACPHCMSVSVVTNRSTKLSQWQVHLRRWTLQRCRMAPGPLSGTTRAEPVIVPPCLLHDNRPAPHGSGPGNDGHKNWPPCKKVPTHVIHKSSLLLKMSPLPPNDPISLLSRTSTSNLQQHSFPLGLSSIPPPSRNILA